MINNQTNISPHHKTHTTKPKDTTSTRDHNISSQTHGPGKRCNALPVNELKGRPGFKIVHLNVRSLVSKIEQLRMDLPSSGIDILSISKSWLRSDIEEKLTTIPNYNIIRFDRRTKRANGHTKTGGGLCIYHKDSLQVDYTKLNHLNVSNGILEVQWVVITRPHTKRILMGNVYRQLDGNLKEAFEQLGDALDRIEELDKYETLIIGDLNADASNDILSPRK